MFSMGLGSAVNTRVANELGAGHMRGARFSARVAMFLSAAMQVAFGITLWLCRYDIVQVNNHWT